MSLPLAILAICLLSALGLARAVPAADLLRRARESRATWDDAFPGFTAALVVWDGGEKVEGAVRVAPDGEVAVDLPAGAAREWAAEQLRSEVVHLKAGPSPFSTEADYAEGDGEGDHPLGPLVNLRGDRFASSYRIDDDRIREVSRTMGETRFSIRTLLTRRNAEGKHLPHVYSVTYWNAGTGDLVKVETFEVSFARVGDYDLPAARTLIASRGGGSDVRRMELSGHRLATA